jgi:hypothetical protein
MEILIFFLQILEDLVGLRCEPCLAPGRKLGFFLRNCWCRLKNKKPPGP